MTDSTFREAQTAQTSQEPETPAEVTGVVADPENTPKDVNRGDTLEHWELQNGKYGLSYLGIQNIGDTFPLKMQFGQLDKYIKAEIAERGLDATPESWQNILKEIEDEIGTDKNAYKRLEKLSNYLKVLNKIKALKKLQEKYKA